MSHVVYHKETFQRLGHRSYKTERAAKAALTRHLKESAKNDACHTFPVTAEKREDYVVSTYTEYVLADPIVNTYSLMDPERKPIPIRLSQKGTCVDPAMERFHTM